MKKLLFLAVALAAVSCAKEPAQGWEGTMPVSVDPTITRATEVDFEQNDQIGLSILTADNEQTALNHAMTFDGEKFVSTAGLLWYEDLGLESTLTAYYPYAEGEAEPTEFTIATDQTGEGYFLSDLLMARKEGVKPSVNAVDMTFRHKLTKIAIELNNDYGMTVEGVKLHNVVPTAVVDLAAQSATVKEGVEATTVDAREVEADKRFAAIIVPQSAALKVDILINKNGTIETHTQRLAEATLQGGGQYSMEVTLLPTEVDVVLSGDIADWEDMGSLTAGEVPFEEFDGYFVYDGETYRTVVMDDGNTWMAENLRFVPDGKTVSSDATQDAGIWYPATNADKKADPALVATKGLLYDFSTAFGKEITAENAHSFEGTQGICPKGWHIPTNAELTGLVGHNANGSLVNTEAPYYDASIKGASIAALDADGYNWTCVGTRNKTSVTGSGSYNVTSYTNAETSETIYGAMSYMLGSTCYQVKTDATTGQVTNVQYYSFMSLLNASNEKVSVAYGNFKSGYSLRCVKDKQ